MRWVDPSNVDRLAEILDPPYCHLDTVQEQGLEAARAALSERLLRVLEVPCAGDADCEAPDLCVAEAGFCGGHNAGFLREDATLEVVVFSGEDDDSPGSIDYYAAFLRGLKHPGGSERVRVHAIAGDEPGGCEAPDGSWAE